MCQREKGISKHDFINVDFAFHIQKKTQTSPNLVFSMKAPLTICWRKHRHLKILCSPVKTFVLIMCLAYIQVPRVTQTYSNPTVCQCWFCINVLNNRNIPVVHAVVFVLQELFVSFADFSNEQLNVLLIGRSQLQKNSCCFLWGLSWEMEGGYDI